MAQEYKAAGMVLYGDPKDYASDNTAYPDSWGLPPNAIPRGNIVNVKGDPLTPGYPSVGKIVLKVICKKVNYLISL